ncbi:MAG TPA: glutathione peroxidase [Flavipsychrobacter sp.]|nr:glutathione peroxidase [Flavipsychrobacter sp.]
MWVKQRGAKAQVVNNESNVPAPVSFYSLSTVLTSGKELSFGKLRGRKVLLVNTASDCGYTGQYAELQKLYQHSREDLEIIAFPANDFKEQEKGTDEEIAAFCTKSYGVSFPIAKKSHVVKGADQHPVYRWLTKKELNGWNDKDPSWNFSKFLINEEGMLTHYFEPSVSPVGEEMIGAVHS